MWGNSRFDSPPAHRARPWIVTSASALGWAAFTMVMLHLVSERDPITDTLSRYAFTRRGGGMLEAGVLAVAFGSLALLGALVAANLPVRGTPAVLLALWACGLSVAAVFPASFTAHPAPVSGVIHQWSCITAFLCLPGFGFSLAERMRVDGALAGARRQVRRLTSLSTVALAVFGISYLLPAATSDPVLDALSDALPVGFAQRVALGTDLLLLAGLLVVVTRAARARAQAVPSHHGLPRAPASGDDR